MSVLSDTNHATEPRKSLFTSFPFLNTPKSNLLGGVRSAPPNATSHANSHRWPVVPRFRYREEPHHLEVLPALSNRIEAFACHAHTLAILLPRCFMHIRRLIPPTFWHRHHCTVLISHAPSIHLLFSIGYDTQLDSTLSIDAKRNRHAFSYWYLLLFLFLSG